MSEKITFFIFGAAGAPVKQVAVSKTFLFFISFITISCMTTVGLGIYDYYNLKMMSLDTRVFENKVRTQQDEIAVQRKQIQAFAGKINSLKSKLLALNDFEKRIRIIAGLDSDTHAGIFGIGGSIPEDLDTGIDLKEKHNSLIREMHNQVKQIDLASVNQEEGFEYLLKHLADQGNLLAHTPAIRPVRGLITSSFGTRISPFTGQKEFHKGLDIANRKGTSVVAAADGTVTFADEKGNWGKLITINHGHGIATNYAHLNKFLKKPGDTVKRGDVIGEIGSTGRTTGPHLHYEVRLNGTPVNPKRYILN
ncbi:M23 family metallopeptidase [Desulfobacterales bacterium HSG2]|nr:M23 family metallopeptidase [Desulfobacterales bacterium HSG2]